MHIEFIDFSTDFNRVDLSYIAILFDLINRIYFFLICIIRIIIALYAKINMIVTFINVFEDIFARLDIRTNLNININVVFNRQK